MSESEEAAGERALDILTRALQEAGIEERSDANIFPGLFGGTAVYWQRTRDDIELVFYSTRWGGATLNASLFLKRMIVSRTQRHVINDDATQIKELVAVIAYVRHVISTLLSRVQQDLSAKQFNKLFALYANPSAEEKELLDKLKPMLTVDYSFESEDKKLRSEIRGPRKRGGGTRTPHEWRDEATLKLYAQRVNDRWLLTKCLKRVFDTCGGVEGWTEDLQQDTNFQLLSSLVSGEMIGWAIRRVMGNASAREKEPLSIACEMACRELNLTPQSVDVLQEKYRKGAKLLKQKRQ